MFGARLDVWYDKYIEKLYKIPDGNKLTYGRGYVYSLQYHIVWRTKYRKPVLKEGMDIRCKELLQEIAEQYSFQIIAMEVQKSK